MKCKMKFILFVILFLVSSQAVVSTTVIICHCIDLDVRLPKGQLSIYYFLLFFQQKCSSSSDSDSDEVRTNHHSSSESNSGEVGESLIKSFLSQILK